MKIPEPEFQEKFGGFTITFRKDILTEKYLANIGFNERQIEAVKILKRKSEITNKEYSDIFKITDRTALNDLRQMSKENIIERIGKTGRSTKYRLKAEFNFKLEKPEINPKIIEVVH